MHIFKEAILEPPARWWRYRICQKYLPAQMGVVLDLGSGPNCVWGRELAGRYKEYIAIDPLLKIRAKRNWRLISRELEKKIPLADGSVDVVVSTAFIEHVEYPLAILSEAIRILKKGGVLVLTTPTPRAKNILEFLSFKLGLISVREIAEHKNYFDKESLIKMLIKEKIKKVRHQYFELGLNNLLVIEK